MNEIKQYLDTPETHRLYSTGVALLAKYGLPAYQAQYGKIAGAPTANNREELLRILKLLEKQNAPSTAPAGAAGVAINISVPPPAAEDLASTEVKLLLDVRRMRQERAKLSQQFHSCQSDEERAAVCDAIERQNQVIAKQEGVIAYFQRHRKMPRAVEEYVDTPLPENEKELIDARRRLSSNILKKEKMIDFVLSLPETDRSRAKLPKYEKELNYMLAKRTQIRQKLKDLREAKEEE